MAASKRKKQRLSSEERRKRIIDAALRLFAQKGYSGTRTREIAELAGISDTLLFQHFKTKEELYRTAVAELYSDCPLIPEVEDKMLKGDDHGVFSTVALRVMKHLRQDRRIMRLSIFSALEGSHSNEVFLYVSEAILPLRQFLTRYIQQRIDEGMFRGINAEIAARLFIETVYMCVTDQEVSLSGPPIPFPDEEVVDTLVTVFLHGLAA